MRPPTPNLSGSSPLPVIGIGVLAVLTILFTAIATLAAVTGAASLLVAAWYVHHRERADIGNSRTGAASTK